MNLLWFLLVGGVAGWLAGVIMKGGGFGILADILLGIVGGVVGGWIFGKLGVAQDGSLLGALITSVVGAVVLIVLVRLIKKA